VKGDPVFGMYILQEIENPVLPLASLLKYEFSYTFRIYFHFIRNNSEYA
jgi:hypothetical protein